MEDVIKHPLEEEVEDDLVEFQLDSEDDDWVLEMTQPQGEPQTDDPHDQLPVKDDMRVEERVLESKDDCLETPPPEDDHESSSTWIPTESGMGPYDSSLQVQETLSGSTMPGPQEGPDGGVEEAEMPRPSMTTDAIT